MATVQAASARVGRDTCQQEAGDRPVRRPLVLAATILASAMAFIDGSVVTIALPALQNNLSAGFDALQWVVNAYTLALGGLLLVGGGLGDRLGHRRIFALGIAIFTAASLACALAPTIGLLIAARAVQGIGAALLVPQSLAIISACYPKDVRGRAIGTWAAASAITTVFGPVIGGFLVDTISWRAAFWINLPIAAVALWLTWRFVPESRDRSASGRLDWTGSTVAVLSLAALTYGLTATAAEQPNYPAAAIAVVLGLAGLVLFARLEQRAESPIMPPELFRLPTFLGVNVVTVFLYGALSGLLFLLPFDLIARRGIAAAEVGLTLAPFGLIIGVFSRFTGAIADRVGPRPMLVLGSALVALGTAVLALGLADYWLGVFVPLLVMGAGMAIAVSPLTTAVMNAVPDDKSGAASGINNAASRLAGLLAIAIIGAVGSLLFHSLADTGGVSFGTLPPPGDAAREPLEAAFVSAYSIAMWVAAAWAALAAVAAWTMVRPSRRDASGVAPQDEENQPLTTSS